MGQAHGVSVGRILEPYLLQDCILKQALDDNSFIQTEKIVLEKLKNSKLSGSGFPRAIDQMTQPGTKEICLKPLGFSLAELLESNPSVINTTTICKIMMQLIDRVEELHKIGFRHGNINP